LRDHPVWIAGEGLTSLGFPQVTGPAYAGPVGLKVIVAITLFLWQGGAEFQTHRRRTTMTELTAGFGNESDKPILGSQTLRDEGLIFAVLNGSVKMIEDHLSTGAAPQPALAFAAWYGRTEALRILLRHGANVHTDNNKAIQLAATHGHADTVEALLEAGADSHVLNNATLQAIGAADRPDIEQRLRGWTGPSYP